MTLRDQVKEMITRTGCTETYIAQEVGLSSSTINLWLNEKYNGNNNKIEKTIAAFVKREMDRSDLEEFEVRYVETRNSRIILQNCRHAQLSRKIVVITGESGYGKTTGLEHYCELNPGCLYLEVNPAFNAQYLIKEICIALGISATGSMDAMVKEIIAVLKGTRRLIIIDQAELLNVRSLDLLRCIHDQTRVGKSPDGIGIVFAGLPRLVENIRGKHNEFAYQFTRVRHVKLTPLQPEDIRPIVEAYLGDDADDVFPIFAEESRRNARTLANLIGDSMRVVHKTKEKITEKIIRECAKRLEV